MTHFNEAIKYFRNTFGKEDTVLRVPCRVNIIGEHIDYCGATVLSFAAEPCMYFIISRAQEEAVNVCAYDRNELESISHESISEEKSWAGYLIRILKQLKLKHDFRESANVLFTSNIPVGAGMSSSSALCCGFVSSLNELFDLGLSALDIIRLGSIAEHEQGLIGGLMDQYTIVNGLRGHALYLDCGKLDHLAIPLDLGSARFILINSNVNHELVESEYNDRRTQLKNALAELNGSYDQLTDILQLNMSELNELENNVSKRRLRHVITEVERVHRARVAVQKNDLSMLGNLMIASHNSLMSDYEVSCVEIDFLFHEMIKQEGVYGARIMGGGFGGCLICLVDEGLSPHSLDSIFRKYSEHYNLKAELIDVSSVDGIGILNMGYS